jgi:hypothetical protein
MIRIVSVGIGKNRVKLRTAHTAAMAVMISLDHYSGSGNSFASNTTDSFALAAVAICQYYTIYNKINKW